MSWDLPEALTYSTDALAFASTSICDWFSFLSFSLTLDSHYTERDKEENCLVGIEKVQSRVIFGRPISAGFQILKSYVQVLVSFFFLKEQRNKSR